jgi:hypothetical protein
MKEVVRLTEKGKRVSQELLTAKRCFWLLQIALYWNGCQSIGKTAEILHSTITEIQEFDRSLTEFMVDEID